MSARARGQAGRVCVVELPVKFQTRTLQMGGPLSSGIVWADADDHTRAFDIPKLPGGGGGSMKALGAWFCPTMVEGGTDFSDGDLGAINLNGTLQAVHCKIRLVDSAGSPIENAEVSASWNEHDPLAGETTMTGANGWTATPCGVEAVLEIEDGPYGTVTAARWTLPETVTLVFE